MRHKFTKSADDFLRKTEFAGDKEREMHCKMSQAVYDVQGCFYNSRHDLQDEWFKKYDPELTNLIEGYADYLQFLVDSYRAHLTKPKRSKVNKFRRIIL